MNLCMEWGEYDQNIFHNNVQHSVRMIWQINQIVNDSKTNEHTWKSNFVLSFSEGIHLFVSKIILIERST